MSLSILLRDQGMPPTSCFQTLALLRMLILSATVDDVRYLAVSNRATVVERDARYGERGPICL